MRILPPCPVRYSSFDLCRVDAQLPPNGFLGYETPFTPIITDLAVTLSIPSIPSTSPTEPTAQRVPSRSLL